MFFFLNRHILKSQAHEVQTGKLLQLINNPLPTVKKRNSIKGMCRKNECNIQRDIQSQNTKKNKAKYMPTLNAELQQQNLHQQLKGPKIPNPIADPNKIASFILLVLVVFVIVVSVVFEFVVGNGVGRAIDGGGKFGIDEVGFFLVYDGGSC